MTLVRRGIKLTEKGGGVEVIFPSGEKRVVINRTMPDAKDYEAQEDIITRSKKPADYHAPSFGGGICR